MNRSSVALFLLALSGCELPRECTLMYAPDMLTIEVEAADWAAGAWTVEVDDLGCSLALPGGADLICDEGLSVTLTEDGAGIASLSVFDGAPDTAEVVFALDGDEVHRQTVTPVYEEAEPNGEGCGITRYGDATVTL